jgi:hypothetical protein
MKKIAFVLALSAIAAPSFAGSMHGNDWGNLVGAILAPPAVVVVEQPAPVYAPAPVYVDVRPRFVESQALANPYMVLCRYENGAAIQAPIAYGCPARLP